MDTTTNASQRRVDKDDPNGKRIVSVAGVYIKSQMAPQAVEYTSDDDTTFTEHIPKTVETVKTDPSCVTIANTNLASVEEVTNNTAHAETVVSKHTEIVADTNSNDRNLDADTSKTVSKKSKFLTYFTKIMLRPNNWTPLVIFVMALELATIVISRFLTYLTKIMRRPSNWTPLVMFVMALELATIVMVAQLCTIAVMNLSSTVSSFVLQPEPSWFENILCTIHRVATHCGLAPQPPPSMISQIADYVTGIAGISQ